MSSNTSLIFLDTSFALKIAEPYKGDSKLAIPGSAKPASMLKTSASFHKCFVTLL